MESKNSGFSKNARPKIFDLIEQSTSILESSSAGFVFPVSAEVRNIDTKENLAIDSEGKNSISKIDLFKAMLAGAKQAWETAIQPRIEEIRNNPVGSSTAKNKEQTDFFTEADTASERVIKQSLIAKFGEDTLRIFAEEINQYTGNLESQVTIRIDPIDGTETFKYGKPGWGIMVGAYAGVPGQERQAMALIYCPELNSVIYSIDDVGTYVGDTETGETKKVSSIPEQNEVANLMIVYWQHTHPSKRGNLMGILSSLETLGAKTRTMDSSAADIREALLTEGKRVIITEGGNQVDYIAYAPLVRLGYKIYDWNGKEWNPDDPEVASQKVVVVPPGKAGKKILETIISKNN